MDSRGRCELDETFALLQSARRRSVLHYLRHESDTADVPELASALGTWESEDGDAIADGAVASVEVSLRHVHLPKLAESGTIAYEPENGRVALADASTLDPYLARAERVDRPM